MNLLKALANWKVILFFCLLSLFFIIYLFPLYQAKIEEVTGTEFVLLDARLHYSFSEVEIFLKSLEKNGMADAKIISGNIDMLYPLVYGLFLILLVLNLTKDLKQPHWKYLMLVPLVGVLFDYLENFGILRLLEAPNQITAEQVSSCARMTFMKWSFLLATCVIVVVLGGYRAYGLIRK